MIVLVDSVVGVLGLDVLATAVGGAEEEEAAVPGMHCE